MVNYRTIVPPLAAMLAVVLFARLGIWQLHRADEAKALQAGVEASAAMPAVRLDAAALGGDLDALHWRRVEARGAWEGGRQVLLDNQVSQGVAGYLVYTPLRIPGCRCAVLVNRGWLPAGPRRDIAPDVGLLPATGSVRGIAAPAPASGFGVRDDGGELLGTGLLRVQKLDAVRLSHWLGIRVLPLTVLLAPDQPDGFRRDWRPPEGRADRNLAYAAQWFVFAIIAAFMALRLNSARR